MIDTTTLLIISAILLVADVFLFDLSRATFKKRGDIDAMEVAI